MSGVIKARRKPAHLVGHRGPILMTPGTRKRPRIRLWSTNDGNPGAACKTAQSLHLHGLPEPQLVAASRGQWLHGRLAPRTRPARSLLRVRPPAARDPIPDVHHPRRRLWPARRRPAAGTHFSPVRRTAMAGRGGFRATTSARCCHTPSFGRNRNSTPTKYR